MSWHQLYFLKMNNQGEEGGGLTRGVGLLILFLAGFFLVSIPVTFYSRGWFPIPYMGSLTLKTWLYEQEKEIDFIFLGTSRYNTGINSEAFDAEMAKLGCHVHSFNMGVDALNPIEARYLIHWMREKRPNQSLRLILGQMVARYAFHSRQWDRTRFFNTWSNLPLFVEDIWRLPILKRHRVTLMAEFLGTFAYEQTGTDRLSPFFFPDRQTRFDPNVVRSVRGYVLGTEIPPLEKRQEMADGIQNSIKEINGWLEDYRPRNGPGHMSRMVPLVEEARSLGYSVGVVLSPSILIYAMADPMREAMARAHPDIPVWNYADPKRYPEFFQAENLIDGTHINYNGASLLARTMAGDICPTMLRGGL